MSDGSLQCLLPTVGLDSYIDMFIFLLSGYSQITYVDSLFSFYCVALVLQRIRHIKLGLSTIGEISLLKRFITILTPKLLPHEC